VGVALRTVARCGLLASLALTPIPIVNGLTNGRLQLAIDRTNADLLVDLARQTPEHGTVLLNLPQNNEYLFEVRLQLQLLYGRADLRVVDLGTAPPPAADDVRVATPRMDNQELLTPRVGVYEAGARQWRNDLLRRFGTRLETVDSVEQRVPLVLFAPEKPLCRLVGRIGLVEGLPCDSERPTLNRNTFAYGWDVYRVLPS
jgi:hypothetical protein